VKLHDLQPAPGSTKARTRVGRGIAAGKGKTAGRGTKGQRSRAGASIPAWFEGGQTPIHVRVPKLRGFKRRERIEYQVVNVGRIAEYAVTGRFGEASGKDPLTVNAEVLASAGLIRHADRPVKVLGQGEAEVKLFVAADAFTAAARAKIEAAGGFVQVLAPQKASASSRQPAAVSAAAAAPEGEVAPAQDASAAAVAAEPDMSIGEAVVAPDEPVVADAGDDTAGARATE
jgi:large subunit ribosomal protein L15